MKPIKTKSELIDLLWVVMENNNEDSVLQALVEIVETAKQKGWVK